MLLATLPTGFRRRWPFALLLASLALTSYAVFVAQRVERSNSSVEARALKGYADFAGWSYAQHLQESMRTIAREALGAVNHGDMLHMPAGVPDANDLPHYLPMSARCDCHVPKYGPIPETFFSFRIGERRLQWATNTHPMPMEGWQVDRPMMMPAPAGVFMGYDRNDVDSIVSKVTSLARDVPDREHGYTYVLMKLSTGPRIFAYTLMPTARGDTFAYGVQYSPEGLRSVLRDVYDNGELLPVALVAGRRNRDLIDVEIRDTNGYKIFAPHQSEERELVSVTNLPPRFASLSVAAGIRPNQASTLVVGGLPGSRLPFLLGLLALAATLTVVAVIQLRREAELSGMRANWISSVSHELRTPLAQIRLYVDTVRLGRATEPAQRDWALAHVDRETTRLHHLVENVLRFSQVGAPKTTTPRPTDVSAESCRIVEEFRPLVESRRVTIDARIDATPEILLRPDSLRHVLLNLLDNAVKYGPDGQTITVSVSSTSDELRIVVSDQGRGVPASESDDIWRPFTRGRAGQQMTGSGIGLSIVRDVAEQHGGRAWVDAAPGGGARFTVALPLVLASA